MPGTCVCMYVCIHICAHIQMYMYTYVYLSYTNTLDAFSLMCPNVH